MREDLTGSSSYTKESEIWSGDPLEDLKASI